VRDLAVLATVVTAKFIDPVGLLQIAVAALMGLLRARWWTPAALSAVFTAVTLAMFYSWWIETGLIHSWPRGVTIIFLGYFVTAYFGYVIGRMITRVRTALRTE
jgi:hypothetical protein